MTKIQNQNYDLEERTFNFTKRVIEFCKKLVRTVENIELIRQVVRASGSVGANYIEANESLSKKDFMMRIKISRKESKESRYWLRLIIDTNNLSSNNEGKFLIQEASEFIKIFNSILTNSK
ncbi:MAG: S23 ribosomal protein [Parcubacteria group bacterium Athens1014_10]|nr:MAG: S23 ribosomal protein [Parcubacteria group bacterium Athens1014_10]TSD05923.1 MAG: S23 ribosomal protein [Parcubacteria group bacterium Athens0714_12]